MRGALLVHSPEFADALKGREGTLDMPYRLRRGPSDVVVFSP